MFHPQLKPGLMHATCICMYILALSKHIGTKPLLLKEHINIKHCFISFD